MLVAGGAMHSGGVAATSIVPLMRYRDCAAAVAWLQDAFGFERHFVVGSDDGGINYAQMTCGSGMVMLAPVGESDLDTHLKQPDEVGGQSTQCCYLVVEDIDAHYAKAKAAGAEIVLELKATSMASRGYSCRDCEGHIWNFGSYDPWKGRRLPDAAAQAEAAQPRKGLGRDLAILGLCLSAMAVTLFPLGAGWLPAASRWIDQATTRRQDTAPAAAALERAAAEAAERAARAEAALADHQAARAAAETALDAAKLDLERAEAARVRAEANASAAVERIATDVRQAIEQEKSLRESSERRAVEAETELARTKTSLEEVSRTLEDTKAKLAAERLARAATDAARKQAEQMLSTAPPPVITGSTEDAAVVEREMKASGPQGDVAPLAAQSGITPSSQDDSNTKPKTRVKSWERQVREPQVKRKKDKPKSNEGSASGQAKSYKPKAPKPARAPDAPNFNIL